MKNLGTTLGADRAGTDYLDREGTDDLNVRRGHSDMDEESTVIRMVKVWDRCLKGILVGHKKVLLY